ncbi:hypothetical protein [Streptomyces sp. SID3343]|uniref:hypothetical protein n=1 Tax=Streptomyces sp. SID3343 TaxID=2690260 RepID=UPI001369149C|nr:hypothetical protein [Streptomyces sp. SID3343]MYV98374.1 hypothetical protein [Streptomyces sp. SID3343]
MRGRWEETVIVVGTNAAPHLPGTPGLADRITSTRGTVAELRSLTAWAGEAGPHLDELVVIDQGRRHTVQAMVTDDTAAQRVLAGLVLDTDHHGGRRYRSVLPTGHLLTVSVIPKRPGAGGSAQ